MNFSTQSLSCLALIALLAAAHTARAQTVPPAHSHAHGHHHDEPVILEEVVVTASPLARGQAELLSSTSVLSGRELALQQQPSLGETLSTQPGISSTYFGPGASRPIIRGLGANRVRVLQNGVDTIDASNTSPDHAVSVEPFLVKRIEVVRGPAALLYGSSALGGVVNVIDHRIETEVPVQPVSATVDARYGTNADTHAVGGTVDVALYRREDRGLVLHLDGFQREADDLEVPGAGGEADVPGRIPGTAIDSKGGSVGLSWVGPEFNLGLNYNALDSVYGVAEPDIEIDLQQRRLDYAAELKREFGIFTGLRLKGGVADYEHSEVEVATGDAETTFKNEGFDNRLELLHGPLAGWEGAWGVQYATSDFDAIGDEAFLPPSETDNLAAFVFEELRQGAFTWQLGARVENQTIDTGVTPRFATSESADETTLSLSGGALYALNDTWSVGLSLTRTERAPNAQELFANGPHAGTGRYEIGDPGFDNELAHGVELTLRKRQGFVTGSFNLFANLFDGFIFEEDVPGSFLDEDGNPDPAGLQEARFRQRDALFYGAELETFWHLHEGDDLLDLKLGVDYTVAQDRDGDDLPRIPPLKGVVGLLWSRGPWNAGVDWVLVARQRNVAGGESETPGYGLLGANLGYRFEYSKITYELFVRGSNLTDQTARVHTSFLKDIAPLPGRAVTFGLRASF